MLEHAYTARQGRPPSLQGKYLLYPHRQTYVHHTKAAQGTVHDMAEGEGQQLQRSFP